MAHSFTNRLINESSPYLLQHAHNPVDWHPWGEEALQKARTENKPILVSIGYAACHWCHVMEKESFEDESVATIMNAEFINIKIDREERPDLDHIYMDAVQAMTGSGGWPLNVFLTPEAKPFYGGTYFPPVRAFNRPSWTETLQGIKQAWANKKDDIDAQAATLLEHLRSANDFGQTKAGTEAGVAAAIFDKTQADLMFDNIMRSADTTWGGFGNAPKFPQTFTIQWLLQYHHYSGNAIALQQALLSIDKMIEGGIYDHVGGGLSRYSTDNEWLAPHFEKMLYDNALLLSILADAFQLTKHKKYEQTIRKIISFIEREMMNSEGGFYAALDADSEGVEGKFYVWTKGEIDQLLKEDAPVFCTCFDVSEAGNWEGKNILRILKSTSAMAATFNTTQEALELKLNKCLDQLLKERDRRIRPQLDDKILLGWNALMITALCKAAGALGEAHYTELAEKTMEFLRLKCSVNDGTMAMFHTYKDGHAKYPAFLDDYACLAQAAIHLQELTADPKYLEQSEKLTGYVLENFSDGSTGYFFFTSAQQTDVILRKKEVYDGAVPSGNSIMAENLFTLSVIYNKPEWNRLAKDAVVSLGKAIVKYPTSFGVWASHILRQSYGIPEIVITGQDFTDAKHRLLEEYIPGKILHWSKDPGTGSALLEGKEFGPETRFYLCRNYACQAPVKTVRELLSLLGKTG